MLTTFLATLNPMLMLFFCMATGYLISRSGIMPKNSASVLSKLETFVFCPALSFITMARNCTLSSLGTHGVNVVISTLAVSLAIGIAIPLSGIFAKGEASNRGVYKYALALGNFGYLGDPIVLTLFGEEMLSYYKLFTLPMSVVVYSWGINVLVPEGAVKGGFWKKLFNVPMIALLLGIAVGISGLGDDLPLALTDTLDALKSCMGPVAMLIAGLTVANYGFVSMLKNKKVYAATFLRLAVLPIVILFFVWGFKELVNLSFGLEIGNVPVFLAFFAYAAPLGLNTVVFPEAYGGDSGTGASMAMISHTLCVLTIPLLYALLIMILGEPIV